MKLKAVEFSKMNQRLKSPLIFLLFSISLQAILLIINLRCYSLISGEMTNLAKIISRNIFSGEIALLFLLSIIPLSFYFLKKKLSNLIQLLFMLLAIIYLFVFSVNIDSIIPGQVNVWIMPVERVTFYQFIFIMPIIFYSIVSIATFPSKFNVKQEISMSVILLAVPPFLTYLGYNIIYDILMLDQKYHINQFILPIFVITGTAIMLFAMIRVFLLLYQLFLNKGSLEIIIYIIIGLLMPLGGLILNKYIPFPTDFQSDFIYILTIVNGLILSCPDAGNKIINYAIAIFRLILFPFTVYFFIVFLPFLPLSIPAILAFGAGFLILAPTLLFILHCKRIKNDYKKYFQILKLLKRTSIIAFSLLLIPGVITINGVMDKLSINQALSYIYEPDYIKMNKFEGSRWFIKHGLESLDSKKSGVYMPFISGFYDWLVFDNLVLTDEKMNYLYKAFFGKNMDQKKRDDSYLGSLLGSTGNRRVQSISKDFTSSRNVVINNISHNSESENNFVKTNIKIHMKNLTNSMEEFRTAISIPEGVFVSNYWLHIGNERVQGKLFEKKTAMWIYQMIQSVNRDPGLLFYKNPDLLYLYVFPFSASEQRITEIEFLYPASISPEITIGIQKIKLNSAGSNHKNIIAIKEKDQVSVLLPQKVKAQLPKTKRTPYLHFLIDWSKDSKYANAEVLKNIKQILKNFPEIKYCSITLANFETANLTNSVIPVGELNNITESQINESLMRRGGFCRDRAIKNIILNYNNQAKSAFGDKHFLYFPVIFVIKDPHSLLLTESDFYYFSRLLPDLNYFYNYENGSTSAINFTGSLNKLDKRIIHGQVIILNSGEKIVCIRPDQNDIVHSKDTNKLTSLQIYNPDSGKFQPAGSVKLYNNKLYAEGMKADLYCREKICNPSLSTSLFKPIVMMSKETGILNLLTSYIVVENSAQWKILEQKEKDKLQNKESLDIVNTPEPAAIIIAGLFLLFLMLRAVKSKKRCIN
jgi:hypothetical protein